MALTKAQKAFFEEFARNDLSNTLFPILDAQGINFTQELANELLDMIDLSTYTEIIGAAFLEHVDFAALKRVDKILRSEEYQKVMDVSQAVSDTVHEERIRILAAMIPTEDGVLEEEAQKELDAEQEA